MKNFFEKVIIYYAEYVAFLFSRALVLNKITDKLGYDFIVKINSTFYKSFTYFQTDKNQYGLEIF